MTIDNVIERVQTLIPNQFDDEQLVYWLNHLEATIQRDCFKRTPGQTIIQYQLEKDRNTTLLVPVPYDDMYVNYVAARVAYTNQEAELYSNFNELFSGQLEKFMRDYVSVNESEVRNVRIRNYF